MPHEFRIYALIFTHFIVKNEINVSFINNYNHLKFVRLLYAYVIQR